MLGSMCDIDEWFILSSFGRLFTRILRNDGGALRREETKRRAWGYVIADHYFLRVGRLASFIITLLDSDAAGWLGVSAGSEKKGGGEPGKYVCIIDHSTVTSPTRTLIRQSCITISSSLHLSLSFTQQAPNNFHQT